MKDIVDVKKALLDPLPEEGDNAYKVLILKINNHLMPKENKDFARFQLSEIKQHSSERLVILFQPT